MKKFLKLALIAIIATGIIISCKKNNTGKDYSKSIKDKTWWGMLTNNGKAPEYYSIHFNLDNSFTWNELSGEYAGKWVVNGKQLIITFNTVAVEIKSDISDDNKLTNIIDNNPNSVINSGELIENPNILLEGTTWSGTLVQSGASKPIILVFIPGSQVGLSFDNKPPVIVTYTRSASGGSLRVGSPTAFFGVLTSTREMKGTDIVSPGFSWTAMKQ